MVERNLSRTVVVFRIASLTAVWLLFSIVSGTTSIRLSLAPFLFASLYLIFSALLIPRLITSQRLLGVMLVCDVVLITNLLQSTGGFTNPFTGAFFVILAIAAMLVSSLWTWIVYGTSLLGFASLFFFYREIPELAMHHGHHPGFSLHLQGMFLGFAIIGALLAYVLSKMSHELEELRRERSVTETLQAMTTLAAGAAHELATPLGTMQLISDGLVEGLGRNAPLKEYSEDIDLLSNEAKRCREILSKLRNQSIELQGEFPSRISCQTLFDQVLGRLTAEKRERITVECPAGITVCTLQYSFAESLRAVIENALDAADPSTKIECSVSAAPDSITFRIRNFGDTVSADIIKKIGQPFFTTKNPGGGMGLGVFLVKQCLRQLKGSFLFHSASGVTEVFISIPKEHTLL